MAIFIDEIEIIGDSGNTLTGGSITINFTNDNGNTLLEWVQPYNTAQSLGQVNQLSITGLSGGPYSFFLKDYSNPPIQTLVSFYISTDTCVSITNQTNTFCNLNNGEITSQTSNVWGPQTFLLYDINDSIISQNNNGFFNNLPSGIYYVVADDGGGVFGRSANCIIKESASLEFDLLSINNSSCSGNLGKVYVTNLTGTPPFTYSWSNGVTNKDFITGLTGPSFYTVTITDFYGCSKSETILVDVDPPMGLGSLTVTPPNCFASDGIINLTITGGTAPFYYSGSNGDTQISFLSEVTFSGLPGGNFSIEVTDAGLCKYSTSTTLVSPGAFQVNNVSVLSSNCGGNSGQISVSLITTNTNPEYTYKIFNSSNNLLSEIKTFSPTNTFAGLSSDVYLIQISASTSSCIFQQNYTVVNNEPFYIIPSTTGTSCNLSNGYVNIEVISGDSNNLQLPITISIQGSNNTTFTSVGSNTSTFGNLISGTYLVTVTDGTPCTKTTTVTVDPSVNVDFIMIPVPSVTPNQNVINTFITQGEPPFIINWVSNNVNGQTTASVSNLSAGTYTLEITDSNFCTKRKSIRITNSTMYSSTSYLTICSSNFGGITFVKKGVFQMLMEGFSNLTTGGEGCVLTSATFTAEVIVNGYVYTNTFFSTTNFSYIPSDNLFGDTIKNILLGVYGVGDVQINYLNNTITIFTDCNLPGMILAGALIEINLIISYGIACVSADACCGIISEDGNVAPTGPNFCLVVESGNTGIADYKIVIETD